MSYSRDARFVSGAPSAAEDIAPASVDWRLGRFPNLMPRRIESILLVASPYDAFILEEDGLLTEMIFSEYMELGLSHAPEVRRVATGEAALAAIRKGRFDLVICMPRLGDMDAAAFAAAARRLPDPPPVVLLAASEWELSRVAPRDPRDIDSRFVWHGDPKLFLAIIKMLEDRWNAEHDTREGGVGAILLLEDSVSFRSSLLPIMYAELVKQARAVMADGINRMHRLLRMRARPKILVADCYEQAIALYRQFRRQLFGVILDVRLPRDRQEDPTAGLEFLRLVKAENPDMPALVQSSEPANRQLAQDLGASFADKHSATLHREVAAFMLTNFGFGEFIFRTPDNREVARAADLRAMARVLEWVPVASIEYHARRNHFSNWLRARTEFELAARLRPRRVSEFGDIESLRKYLIGAIRETLRQNRRGLVEDFTPDRYDTGSSFARIGGGSLGGKARGLAFMDGLLARYKLDRLFPGVRLTVPRSVVIGTEVFAEFLARNNLRAFALRTESDALIAQAFAQARLPEAVVEDLRAFLATARFPIAVRSSSLLEDSPYYPFAGVYTTRMIPNNDPRDDVRLEQLQAAIQSVYASTFMAAARQYLASTPYHIEEQQMGVILQQVIGAPHEHYFYPDIAGVACSYNFYPFGQMKPEEGVAHAVLGLGALVVEGGEALRFCPKHPQVLPQLGDPREFLEQSQRGFYALDLAGRRNTSQDEAHSGLVRLDLDAAERHGTLAAVGSVWSAENEALYDGIYRPGARVVTFAHVLKSDIFPLAGILERLLEIGREGMSGPVEIEFAANLTTEPREFALLQIRPYFEGGQTVNVTLDDLPRNRLVCRSPQALGHGVITDVRDIVYVVPERFDPLKTREIAREVGAINHELRAARRPCVMIGPGRWGSSNPALGIPVTWGQISSARTIIETFLEHFRVDPSQGSHFFHNLTSQGVSYFTVDPRDGEALLDWAWLARQPAHSELAFVRHVRLREPLEIRVDGRRRLGAIYKPAPATARGKRHEEP